VFFANILMVKLRRRRLLIRDCEFAGRSLPGIIIAFVIVLLHGCWFWYVNYADRTEAHVRDAAVDRA
jgi:hypothetical protein